MQLWANLRRYFVLGIRNAWQIQAVWHTLVVNEHAVNDAFSHKQPRQQPL
ncbi:hypothetical protein HMPREF6745_1400 [Prevotella sp. oral taxon 472 str. F0295]|nr:hypothetical protein HMPREF6745_1400 [Prevotella sp. oral taxon 472 str. F0295]